MAAQAWRLRANQGAPVEVIRPPISRAEIEAQTRAINATKSPWTDECIRVNERFIHAMHRALGLPPPNLPPPLPEPER